LYANENLYMHMYAYKCKDSWCDNLNVKYQMQVSSKMNTHITTTSLHCSKGTSVGIRTYERKALKLNEAL